MVARATSLALALLVWLRNAVPLLLLSNQALLLFRVNAFHDCVQSRKRARNRGRRGDWKQRPTANNNDNNNNITTKHFSASSSSSSSPCEGGICVGMTNGPHQGGNASYPVAWNGTTGTFLESYMTIPEYPSGLATTDDFSRITYYIWTDVFFGDESFGRMNQLVPQLILGSALDGSSGVPNFQPEYNEIHTTWVFGSHYFFEIWNPTTNTTDAHAAYGTLVPAVPGETLKTTFELLLPEDSDEQQQQPLTFEQASARRTTTTTTASSSSSHSSSSDPSPAWKLTMSVVGDPSRTSVLTVFEPYMGLGRHWKPKPSTSWLEPNFRNMCINACWELYGATDSEHLPASGAKYKLQIEQPAVVSGGRTDDDDASNNSYEFTTWERDEGNGICPSCNVSEVHNERKQEVFVEIHVDGTNNKNDNKNNDNDN